MRLTMTTKGIRTAIRMALLALCVAAPAQRASGQETINHASISGRVTDPSGGVVAGAQVTARQTDTNLTGETTTDGEGRFRFPYLKVGPYEITVRQAGFADATRQLTLTVAAAFELPVVAGDRHAGKPGLGHRAGDCARGGAQPDRRHDLAGGGQESSAQRAQLPRPGAARAWRVSAQRRRHAALCRDLGGGRRRHLGRQPAQLLQQLHRRRPFGERRCGRTERHSLRRGCGGPVSGRHVRRAGRTGPRAGRLHQRPDQERDECGARRHLRLLCATTASMRPTP